MYLFMHTPRVKLTGGSEVGDCGVYGGGCRVMKKVLRLSYI